MELEIQYFLQTDTLYNGDSVVTNGVSDFADQLQSTYLGQISQIKLAKRSPRSRIAA